MVPFLLSCSPSLHPFRRLSCLLTLDHVCRLSAVPSLIRLRLCWIADASSSPKYIVTAALQRSSGRSLDPFLHTGLRGSHGRFSNAQRCDNALKFTRIASISATKCAKCPPRRPARGRVSPTVPLARVRSYPPVWFFVTYPSACVIFSLLQGCGRPIRPPKTRPQATPNQKRSLPGAALEAAGSGERRSGVPGGPAGAPLRRRGTEDAPAQPSVPGAAAPVQNARGMEAGRPGPGVAGARFTTARSCVATGGTGRAQKACILFCNILYTFF